MQKLLIALASFVFLLAAVSPAEAQNVGTTTGNFVFCVTLEKHGEQLKLAASGDRVAWESFMRNEANGCAVLKAGLRVYFERVSGLRNLGMIRIRPEGTTVWFYTNTEAVGT